MEPQLSTQPTSWCNGQHSSTLNPAIAVQIRAEVSRQILKTELKKRMQHCTRQHHRLCFNASPVRKAILPNPWVPFDERTLSIPDGTTSQKVLSWLPLKVFTFFSWHQTQSVLPKEEQSEPEVFCGNRPRGVTVSTLDSESSDRGSTPREVSRPDFEN